MLYTMASVHYADGRFTPKSRGVSKPRDWMLWWSDRSELWQASRQQRCCRGACQISERYDHYNIQSRGFETLRNLSVLRASVRSVNRGPGPAFIKLDQLDSWIKGEWWVGSAVHRAYYIGAQLCKCGTKIVDMSGSEFQLNPKSMDPADWVSWSSLMKAGLVSWYQ